MQCAILFKLVDVKFVSPLLDKNAYFVAKGFVNTYIGFIVWQIRWIAKVPTL